MNVSRVHHIHEHRSTPVEHGPVISGRDAALGISLREHYPEVVPIDPASRLGRVLARLSGVLDAAEAEAQGAVGFRADLIAAAPHLRRFALSLTRDAVESDDLVQFTLLKAWEHRARFQPGTRMIAWLFTILRNGYLNGRIKHRLEVPDTDGAHAARLARPADQEHTLHVQDLQAALDRLDPVQREALLLIALDDLSYEEAAEILGCPSGTVKSRVSRARNRLARDLGDG